MAVYCPVKFGMSLYPDCKECTEHICEYFFCLVAGTRTFDDYDFLKQKLNIMLQNYPKTVIVSGGAKGADSLAERYAEEYRLPFVLFPAEWDRYGKAAGYIRNKKMHEYIANMKHRGCAAFWDGKSKGTAHNFQLAEKYGTQIRIIRY